MKRYLAFYGRHYYPDGGMDDFIGDFNGLDAAKDYIEAHHKKENPYGDLEDEWNSCWAHVYDMEEKKEVYSKH